MGSNNLIVSIIVSIGIVLGYLLFFSDTGSVKEKEQKTTAQIKELEKKIETIGTNGEVAPVETLEGDITRMKQDLQSASMSFPTNIQIPLMLKDLSKIGDACGLQFLLFEPQDPVNEGFYEKVPIKLKLRGTFPQIGNFMFGISKLNNVVLVEDLKISGVVNLSGMIINEADAVIMTYRLTSGGASE